MNAYLFDTFPGNVVWEQSFGVSGMLSDRIHDERPFCIKPPCSDYTREQGFLTSEKNWGWPEKQTHTCWFDQRFQEIHALNVQATGIHPSRNMGEVNEHSTGKSALPYNPTNQPNQ